MKYNLLSKAAQRWPERTFIYDNTKEEYIANTPGFTYDEVYNNATKVGKFLTSLTTKQQISVDMVGFLAKNKLEIIETLYGIDSVGLHVMGIPTQCSPNIAENLIKRVNMKVLFVDMELLHLVKSLNWKTCPLDTLVIYGASTDDNVWVLTDAMFKDKAKVYLYNNDVLNNKDLDDIVHKANEDDADIGYFCTSGTTGAPKVVKRLIKDKKKSYDLTFDDCLSDKIVGTIMNNAFAWIGAPVVIESIVKQGGYMVVVEKYVYETYFDISLEFKINLCYAFPLLIKDLVFKLPKNKRSQLRYTRIVCMASLYHCDTLKALCGYFPNALVINAYGQTEVGLISSLICSNDIQEDHQYESVGKPSDAGNEVHIYDLNSNTYHSSKDDSFPHGEICIRINPSDRLCEYVGEPKKTAEFKKDGYFHIGDMGYFDSQGFLYQKGRCKDLIINQRGTNIYPPDIEIVLEALDGVNDVAIFGSRDISDATQVGEEIVAFIVPGNGWEDKKDCDLLIEACKGRCKEYLCDFQLPQHYRIVDALVYNRNGKVDKMLLQKIYQNGA